MRNLNTPLLLCFCAFNFFLFSCNQSNKQDKDALTEKEHEAGYDGPKERDLLEFEKTKDPATGKVPYEKLLDAMIRTESLKQTEASRTLGINWIERGSIYDSVGPWNGNKRGGSGNPAGTYTSGRIRAVLLDPIDPTGNTVFTGGVGGGLWKTTNLLDGIPLWQNVNDFFDNMAISSICIDPSNSNIMYFSTGEPTVNADAIQGLGIWKSTDHGVTWAQLPSTASFTRTFKLLCDNNGNIYAGLRAGGIRRSTDGGLNWINIAPTGFTGSSCPDLELSSTGTLHANMGYFTSSGSTRHFFTTAPGTENGGGWVASTGLPASANRFEMDSRGDTVWICPTSTGNNVNGAYLSVDGGATFVQKNTGTYATGISNTQGWYNISLTMHPTDYTQFIVGGLDAYRSLDTGKTAQRLTYWVSSQPYVHADHHYVKWWQVGGETRILMATDGGLFLSRNNGITFVDKNRNLGLKQFYSCAIHPTLTDYFLAGAQDNGSHQFKNPGLSYSFEVSGGDGAYVAIDQVDPTFQFTSYVYNQYRRTSNDWNSYTSFNFSNSIGLFINPFEYDGINKKMYASYGTTMFRWNNPTTATSVGTSSTDILTIPGSSGNLSSFTISPNNSKRVFIGTSTGKLFRMEYADTILNADVGANTTEITGPGFSGYLNCIATGSSDQVMMAIFTNYGVTNVWHTTDGGTNWTALDGNLPNMPVRWAVFDPVNDDKAIIATEAGVYITLNINGGGTQWVPSADFPTVRTDMLRVRASDNLVAAATHGRGLWTGYTNVVLPVRNITLNANLDATGNAALNWTVVGAVSATKYSIQYSINGTSFTDVATVGSAVSAFKHLLSAPVGYYRIMATEKSSAPVYSNVVAVRSSNLVQGLKLRITPNPVSSSANFVLNSTQKGVYRWILSDMHGRILQTGNGNLDAGGSINMPVNSARLTSGSYQVLVIQGQQRMNASFIKQ